ncbi:hypothetical protein IAT40_001561 [Kwoniella sp. CBS 6097]
MPLPFFLQPLLLVSHYYNRLTQKLTGWLQRSSEQLFGPLEQAVAAVVIIGLAMQAPPALWAPPPPPPPPPQVIAPVIINETTRSPPPLGRRGLSPPPPNIQQGADNPSFEFNPINLVIVLLVLNLVVMTISEEQKRRLRESWDLLWPPWQDRSSVLPRADSSSSSKSRTQEPRSSDIQKKSESEKARETKKVVEQAVNKPPSDLLGDEAKKSAVKPSSSSTASKVDGVKPPSSSSASKEKPPSSSSTKDRAAGTGSSTTSKAKSSSDEPRDTKGDEGSGKDRDRAKEKKLETKPESERARSSKTSSSRADDDTRDKGKSRMEGERPEKQDKSASVTTESEKARDAKRDADPKLKSAMKDTAKSKDDTTLTAKSEDERSPDAESKDGLSSAGTEGDDALMAGDYRPLKSAMKKSKKKPRQNKNIHHNYFMTMRGWRPALIPFPHGFHPKPHYPRNTLWWDNVPRNADHIMAPPPVAKEPEKQEDDDDNGGDKGKKESKKKEDGKDKDKENQKEDKDKGKSVSIPGDKKDGDKDKDKEKAKLKAEAEAKAKAKKAAEASAAATSKSGSGSSSGPSSASDAPQAVPASPQVQKATYLSQALLSVLLFYVNSQLGLLLLTFFVWQFINAHNVAASKLLSTRQPSSNSRQSPVSGSTTASSSSRDAIKPSSRGEEADDKSQAKKEEMRKRATDEKSDQKAPTSERSRAEPQDSSGTIKEPTAEQKLANLEKLIKKLKSVPELNSEMKEKLQKAMVKRKQVMADMQGSSEDISQVTISSVNKVKDDTGPKRSSGTGDEDGAKSTVSADALEKKAKEMDDYVRKMRVVENLSEDQKTKLTKAEAKRRALWKELRTLQRTDREEPTSRNEASIKEPSKSPKPNESTDVEEEKTTSGKVDKLKAQMKEVEVYVMKYRKIADPSDDQKEKLLRAESERRALKRELLALSDQSGVGGSGLSAKDKDGIAKVGRVV